MDTQSEAMWMEGRLGYAHRRAGSDSHPAALTIEGRLPPPLSPINRVFRRSCGPELATLVTGAIDAAMILLAMLLAEAIAPFEFSTAEDTASGAVIAGTALATMVGLVAGGTYAVRRDPRRPLSPLRPLLALAVATGLAGLGLTLAMPQNDTALHALGGFLPLAAAFLLAPRIALRGPLRRMLHAATNPRTVVCGDPHSITALLARLRRHPPRFDILGTIDDGDTPVEGVASLGSLSCLHGMVQRGEASALIIALPATAQDRLQELVDRFSDLTVEMHIANDLPLTSRLGDLTDIAPTTCVMEMPAPSWGAFFKRLFDITGAAVLLVLLMPVLLLTALAIMVESPGGPLFRQERVGYRERRFRIWKFRSMYVPAPVAEAKPGVLQATRGDARISRVGGFIRRTSIDELPQLINILRGDMSLVGPRPHAPMTLAGGIPFEDVVVGYAARHRMRPGLTGLAQMRGWRGETDTEAKLRERVASDLEYIRNWSLTLDLRILVGTAFVVLKMRNAY